jgi:hypothetical protein
MAHGGCGRAERRCGRERRWGVQNPGGVPGTTVPGAVLLVALEQSVPSGPPRPPGGGKSRKRTAAGGRPRTLGSAGAVGSVDGLSLRVDTLFHLVADVQREVVKGAANDGERAVVPRLEWRYVGVPPHEHRWCAGEFIGELRRRRGWAAAVLCLVAECSAVLSVLEKF